LAVFVFYFYRLAAVLHLHRKTPNERMKNKDFSSFVDVFIARLLKKRHY